MLSALSLLLVTTLLSGVMLLVLWSLSRNDIKGVREWILANALAIASLALFAGGAVLPGAVSIEGANTLFMVAIAMMLAGFRRHLGLGVPLKPLAASIAAVFVLLVVFHYEIDSSALRTVSVSAFHGAVCLAIGLAVQRDRRRARYPYRFTAAAAFALAAAHVVRGLVYATHVSAVSAPLGSSTLNLLFLAAGTLVFPVLTLGAVMMANAEIISGVRFDADHDHLTGAWSRRALFVLAEKEHARAERGCGALSLLVFDVDHFKRINDTHGHAAGDQVLVDIVCRTQAAVRSIDSCARIGGEEFAVLLPEADEAMALAVATRLRAQLDHSVHVAAARAPIPYTVSIGTATLEPGEPIDSLLARADQALYAAKAAGRNTVASAPAGARAA